MRGSLAKLGSWGRKALILGALVGAPVLALAPAAEAQPAVTITVGQPAQLVPVQWGPPPRPRPYYGPRHYHRPPPPHWRRHYAYRGYPPPPPRYYRRHHRPHYYYR
ncbi:hypothetical protein SAMN02745194_01737 [Roseomonas rosea]|uniref:PXPV repeat-containing protein n=1 Tax=Muricoccus roseus TaxID=198092 RepID=A0A1M6GFT7_9PROT|nr:hypothetical protein [Roseomonas rosea]SHJ08802.1 hypothetical protein SAMN02745194_01737 [Roseomonas rosea]